ncbi:e3 ubiquitin-protein ligase RNF14 [Caerostris darwini]|uniref:RBR-type E3 ubiquitin transferase n=1 Tax=Caerostris darwini TaxID=1538125 RepID=A0AAV4NTG0_9ARAC|nr:e3 ubiquitin-protein ligase RNF14 [Caerostris darwini]
MSNLESQEMELLALQNIYEDNVFKVDKMDPPSGQFIAHVQIPKNFRIYYMTENKSSQVHEALIEESFSVDHLPPFNLFFCFPETYPLQTCPKFLLSCNWLSLQQLTVLCRHLEYLWALNNEVILFTWQQFLQFDALNFLNITDSLNITELLKFKRQNNFGNCETSRNDEENFNNCCAVGFSKSSLKNIKTAIDLPNIDPSLSGGYNMIDAHVFKDLSSEKGRINLLKDYNSKKKEDIFRSESHICSICFITKKGFDFVIFKACKHWFCRECITSYFEIKIEEGNIFSLNCLDGECQSQADILTIQQVVRKDLFEKYDKMLLHHSLETMPDVTFCPRKFCQCPLVIDVHDRMGTCPRCKFVFCPFCNMTYHGVAPCVFKSKEKTTLFDKYMQGNKSDKAELEKKYGKRLLKSLVEDTLSETWKNSNSKSCPHCKASIEKMEGCNKMTCFKCGTFFCWTCGAHLNRANPYEHFNSRTGDCILFEQNDLDNNVNGYEIQPGEFLIGNI